MAASGTASRPFPRGLAVGAAFCDREGERAELARRVRDGVHTWLAAPRRHGKTSLLNQILVDLGRRRRRGPRVRGVIVDLLPSHDRLSAQRAILDGVGLAVAAALPTHRRILEAASRFFAGLRPRLSVSTMGPKLELGAGDEPAERIADALLGLDAVAGAEGLRAVMVLDEFQQVGELAQAGALEAGIRHAVERSEHVTYIFSGSHRRLLELAFTDPARPLYHLCDPLTLDRIDAAAYRPWLAELAAERWSAPTSPAALEAIVACTERHPWYVNRLCERLWRRDAPPDAGEVAAEWASFAASWADWLGTLIESLSRQQLALLAALAEAGTESPTGREFLARCRVPKSSVAQALDVLLARDHLFRDAEGVYRLVDPALRAYLTGERARLPGV